MKRLLPLLACMSLAGLSYSQNVGIGTLIPSEKLHVVGNRALFETNYVSIGTGEPATGFTSFQINKNVNSFLGMYINSGATGVPFYGYALNGAAKAYTAFNGPAGQFEYHQTSDAIPDFLINGSTKAVFNTGFVGIGTSTPTTGFTGFAMKSSINDFYGAYVDAGATGKPFYGFALNSIPKAYVTFNGTTSQLEYHQTSDLTPDFLVSGNAKAVFNTAFVGIGTSTPTTAFTGFTMKSSINDFYGAYVDAGTTGKPFYGYALNGVPTAYTAFNGTTNHFEYHHTSDGVADFQIGSTDASFPSANFLGIGTSTRTTAFTALAIKSSVNDFFGSYIDAGATGKPFYGYALNGVPTAYTSFNASAGRFEYHHTSDGIADFQIGNTDASFPNATFLGIGTSSATNASTGLTLKKNVNNFFGIYVDAGATGRPFYGYALDGITKSWTELNGITNNWELNYGGTWLSMSSSGFIGMNAVPTSSFRLDVGGPIRCTALTQTSDIRFKKDVEPLNGSLEKIELLRGVSWQWKTDEYPNEQFTDDKQIGFIAQDMEKVIPEVVVTDQKGFKSIDYSKITAVLTEAVKEQQKQIDDLKKENDVLRKDYDSLLKRIEALETHKQSK